MNKLLIISIFFVLLYACSSSDKNNDANTSLNDSIDYVQEITMKLRENPNDPELFFQRAEAYQKINKIENAINDLEFALKIDSSETKYYLKISDFYMYLGKSGKAKAKLEKCELLYPKNTEVLLKLAQIHFFVRQYNESINYLNKIQEIDRNIGEVYFIKALIYNENGDTTNAVRNLHVAVGVNTNYYEAYVLLGLLTANDKDTASLDYYRNAIKIKPQSYEAHYNMAMFYQEREMIKQAKNMYNYIIEKVDSTSSITYFNLAYLSMEKDKDYKTAIDFYYKALQYKPNYFEAHINIGFCYEAMKEYQKAYENYKIALDIAPNYPLAIDGMNRIEKYVTERD